MSKDKEREKCGACVGSGSDWNEGDPCHACNGTGQARAAMAPAGEPVAYLYRDAQTPEDAHPWLNSTMLVLAADRRPTLRNETPLYANPSPATDRAEVLRQADEMVMRARTETACRLAGNSAFKSYADKHDAARAALVRLLGVE